jgi:hypothetical protein
MAVINNAQPASTDGSNNSIGMILVVIVVLILGFLLVVYGLPAMGNRGATGTTPQINVPDKMDVNVNGK